MRKLTEVRDGSGRNIELHDAKYSSKWEISILGNGDQSVPVTITAEEVEVTSDGREMPTDWVYFVVDDARKVGIDRFLLTYRECDRESAN
jgi:hypothetical protein